MRLKPILMSVAIGAAVISPKAMGAHVWEDPNAWWNSHFSYDAAAEKYTDQELSLDLFGSYINPEEKFSHLFRSSIRKGYWGGGVGLNYFLLRQVGIGADMNMSDHPGRIVDQVLGNGILRLPLGNSGLSPYAFGGGGRGISPSWEWVYDAGVGLEMRFTPTTGIFGDARYIWADQSVDRLLIRAGLRVVF